MKRRNLLTCRAALASAPLVGAGSPLLAAPTPVHFPKGKAEHCIFIWLGGGMCQLDTFDPKRRGNPRPGYLGPSYNNVYRTDTESGPAGFTQPEGVSATQSERRQRLAAMGGGPITELGLAHYAEIQEQGRR